MWVNNFQTPEIQAVLSSFFVMVMILQVVVIRVVGGLNIGAQNGTIESQRSSLGPYWTFSQHSELKVTDIGQPFVACPALQAPIQESHDHLMAPKRHLRLTQGLRKAATETRLVTLEQDTQWNVIECYGSR